MMKITFALLLSLLALAAPADPVIHAACTDYTTGMLAGMDAYAPWTAHPDLLSIHSDAVLRWGNEHLAVIGRLGADNVLVLDADDYSTVSQFSTGTASNPLDIVVAGNKAYISRQNENSLLIVSWPGGTTLGTIDLSAWADADGSAELACMAHMGDRLFLAIQRLDRDYYWLPVGDSYLAVVDLISDELVDVDPGQPGTQAILLPATNPVGELQVLGGMIYASCAGTFGLEDGGLVRVDPVSFATTLLFDESALGGDIGDVAFVDESDAYGIRTGAYWATQVVRFDPGDPGGGVTVIAPSSDWVFSDLELYGDQLFVSDQSYMVEGVRVYNAASGGLLSSAISLGLPPYDLLAPREVTAADQTPTLGARLAAWPNPFNPSTTLSWAGLPVGTAQLNVYDISGRRVARLFVGEQQGEGSMRWSAEGLASGVYLARISMGENSLTARLILLQ